MQLPALAGVIFPLRPCGKEPSGSTSTLKVTCSHKLFLCQRRRRAVRVVMGNAIVLTISPKIKIVFWSHYRKWIGPGILRPFQENELLLGKMRELCGWLTLLLSGIDPVCQKDADALNAKSVFFSASSIPDFAQDEASSDFCSLCGRKWWWKCWAKKEKEGQSHC